MTNTSPSAFPVMLTAKQWLRAKPGRPFHSCPTCRLAVAPRNANRHAKACAARKRANPARWREWRDDMYA